MSRPAYVENPFGPFPSSDKPGSKIERHTSGTIDMRGGADWRPVFTVDTTDAISGLVVISCDAIASPTVAAATEVENWPWVEVRILAEVNGQTVSVLLEAGVGSHNNAAIGDDTKSSGPIFLPLGLGEVPDRIIIHARARRGGVAELAGDPDEKLDLLIVSRFCNE